MKKALNRHFTKKWKKKREKHHGDRCSKANCTICHHEKVLKIPKKQDIIQKLRMDDEEE